MSSIKKLLINIICAAALLSIVIVISAILFAENEIELLKAILAVFLLGMIGIGSLLGLFHKK